MHNYNQLLENILRNGVDRPDRTGIGSSFLSGQTLEFDLSDGFPIITTRKVSFRIAFEETMMFLRGETDTTVLEEKNINIWKGNTSREFLDSAGLTNLPVGSLGKGYSHQWRNYGGDLHSNNGIDQVADIINGIRQNPTGRRHIINAWNPTQLSETPLPPCHLMQMYTVDPVNNRLNSCWIQRSADVPYGVPYNIMSYAFLNMAFSKLLGYNPGVLTGFLWDAHIYENQKEFTQEQIKREPRAKPRLEIKKDLETLEDLLALEMTDLSLINYDPWPDFKNKPSMAV